MDKSELIQKMTESRAEFEGLIAQFDDERMLRPVLPGNWTVKDVLAHMAWWARRAQLVISAVLAGQEPVYSLDEKDLDNVNRKIYEDNRLLSLADVRREEAESYRALFALVESLSADDLGNSSKFAWMNGAPLSVLAEWNTFGHYDEHFADLRKALV